jgi:hypothetical protein
MPKKIFLCVDESRARQHRRRKKSPGGPADLFIRPHFGRFWPFGGLALSGILPVIKHCLLCFFRALVLVLPSLVGEPLGVVL